MAAISDDYMKQMIGRAKEYCIAVLMDGPNKGMDGEQPLIWEHARRNFSLRAEGKLSIVCPISDGSGTAGIGIFNTTLEEARAIMDEDPAVKKGVFCYELHRCRSFPGDTLPG